MPTVKPLRLVLEGVDRITAPIRRVSRRIESLTAPIRRVRAGFLAMAKASGLSRIAGATARVGREMAALARRAALVGGALATAAGIGLRRFVAFGDTVAKTADRIGISVEALQELRFAADRSGVSTSVFDQSLGAFSKRLGEARRGTGALATILRKSDPAFLKQIQRAQGVEEAFGLLVEKISSYENASDRSALAAAAFSRAGLPLVNLANAGAEGMEALRLEARQLGFVLSEETARRSERLTDAWTNLGAVARGIATVIGAGLLPVVEQITGDVTKWARANQDLIRTRAEVFARDLAEVVKQTATAMKVAVPIVRDLVGKLGGFKVIASAVAALMAGKLLVAVYGLGAALLTTPIGWFLLAMAALGAAAGLLIKKWEPIKAFFADLWQGVRDRIAQITGALPDFLKRRLGFDTVAGVERQPAGAGVLAPAPQQVLVGGTFRVAVESDRPTRVTELSSEGGIDLEADTGLVMAPAT